MSMPCFSLVFTIYQYQMTMLPLLNVVSHESANLLSNHVYLNLCLLMQKSKDNNKFIFHIVLYLVISVSHNCVHLGW